MEGDKQKQYFIQKGLLNFSDQSLSGLSILPEKFITAVVLCDGYGSGRDMHPFLDRIFKSRKVVYPQYSTGIYSRRKLANGELMEGKIFMLEDDVGAVQKNAGTPMVFVDECIVHGVTIGTMMQTFKSSLGYKGDFFTMAVSSYSNTISKVMDYDSFVNNTCVMSNPAYAKYLFGTQIVNEYGQVLKDGEFVDAETLKCLRR
ncbi:Uncharacterised protein [uncultured archaeon]|nr:Uncharacterised protein [uncultured archaeon]